MVQNSSNLLWKITVKNVKRQALMAALGSRLSIGLLRCLRISVSVENQAKNVVLLGVDQLVYIELQFS